MTRRRRARARGGYRPSKNPPGPRPTHDGEPTPELLAHRAALAGPHGDPTATATPLDVLETRQLITRDQAAAGRDLAKLRYAIFGRIWPCTSPFNGAGDGPPEHVLERLKPRYDQRLAALRQCPARVVSTTISIAVYLCWPQCARDLRDLSQGLTALNRPLTAATALR